MTEVLNPVARDDFARDGFLIVRGLCPLATVRRLRARTEADLRDRQPPLELEREVGYPGAPVSDGPGSETVRRLLGAMDRGPEFTRWAIDEQVLGILAQLLGTSTIRVVRAHHNCIMTKHPAHSTATGWHQDQRYWAYARPELVNAWTALGVEARDNGGMRVIPGSHRACFGAESFDAEKFFLEDCPANQAWLEKAVQVDLAPGDVLFFHAGLLHSAGANCTEERKYSLVFSYRDAANLPIPGTRSAACQDLDPEQVQCD